MVCIDLGYEVVTDTVTLLSDNGNIGRQEFRLAVPTGKVPLSGGYNQPWVPGTPAGLVNVVSSYPDGDEWVFVFQQGHWGTTDVDIYVVALEV